MSDGVIFQMTGQRHANHLIVSVMSLRRHWDGPVTIMAGDAPTIEITNKIKDDKRLGEINVVEWPAPTRLTDHKQNLHYVNKTLLCDQSPYDRTVFLDADTLVVGDFREMFPPEEFVYLTQFSNWVTTGRLISGRIKAWREHSPVDVALMLGHSLPAINTGVIGFTKQSKRFFAEWRELTMKNICFMCDELAAQLIFYRFPHKVIDERWNCSAPFSSERHGPLEWRRKLSEESGEPINEKPDPRIWHGHGFKFIKSGPGRDIWMPYYERAMADNIADIQSLENIGKAPQPWIKKNVAENERKQYSPIQ